MNDHQAATLREALKRYEEVKLQRELLAQLLERLNADDRDVVIHFSLDSDRERDRSRRYGLTFAPGDPREITRAALVEACKGVLRDRLVAADCILDEMAMPRPSKRKARA